LIILQKLTSIENLLFKNYRLRPHGEEFKAVLIFRDFVLISF